MLAWGICLLLLASPAGAEDFFPKNWQDRPNPLASPYAMVGGEISTWGGQYPKSLNYYLDTNTLSAEIFGAMYETLLSMNPITLAYEPGLAEKWSISDDKRSFTFYIDRRAMWSDGRPVTAHDVLWTFDVILKPENLTGPHKIDMERFERPTVLDDRTIRFTARDIHWKNLGAAGGFHILPKHVFEGSDFNKINFEFPVVSGPYRLGQLDEGLFISLDRRNDYWLKDAKRVQGTGNFQTIRFRFFAERGNAFEAFKKGLFDLYAIYTSRLWVNETKGEKFDKNWIAKQKVYNHNPIGFQGFAMNMRKPPFDDLRVRKAMALLLDRQKMNSTLMYNQYFLHRSYFEDLYDTDHPCPNPRIHLDKEKARALLKEAGWTANPNTGFLEKDGIKFSFKFLTQSATAENFLAIYAEDLKDVGIEMSIDKKDWAAWVRDMDEFNYQMTWAAWSQGLFKDPEGMWSSQEAERKGGNNITGFKSSAVDALIEKQKTIFDIHARNAILRKIDRIVFEAYPYVLLWNINYTRLLFWNKFGMPDTVLSKYGDERSAYWYWWLDEDSKADLADAMDIGMGLPPKDSVVHFDEKFGKN